MEHDVIHAIGPGLPELYKLLNVGLVVAIMIIAGRKAVAAMVAERAQNIGKQLVETKKELESMRAQIEKSRKEISEIERLKRTMIEASKVEGQLLYDSIVSEAQKTAERITSDAKAMIEDEHRVAAKKLREALVTEAIQQSLAMIQNSKSGLQEKLHDGLLDKVGEAGVSNGR